jgi:hypothetical protein
VIGGKTGDKWTNTVESLELTFVFQPHLEKNVASNLVEDSQYWKSCPAMSQARSNFSATTIENMVYVFGGISGST